MTEMELIQLQEWRCSVKKFDASKKIPAATWAALEQTLILSPSSYGLQPWKFLVVESADFKQRLTPLSWNQSQIADCSHYVVFTYLNRMDEAYVQKYIANMCETRGTAPDKVEGYKQMMLKNIVQSLDAPTYQTWAAKQVYIALGNFMTSAATLGVDTCPMEGLDPAKYDEVLGLVGTSYSTVVACAAGYRDAEDAYSKMKKVRFPTAELVKHF